MAVDFMSGTGGSDSTDEDTSTTSSTTDETDTFDTSTDTFSVTTFGADTGTDDEDDDVEMVVDDTSDPDASSPAGGAGQTSAVSRFTGIDEEEVSEMSEEDQLATSQEASDDLLELVRSGELDPIEAVNVPTAMEALNQQAEEAGFGGEPIDVGGVQVHPAVLVGLLAAGYGGYRYISE
jgi:hypothetical protein